METAVFACTPTMHGPEVPKWIFSLALVPGILALIAQVGGMVVTHRCGGAPLDTPRPAFQELATKKVGANTT